MKFQIQELENGEFAVGKWLKTINYSEAIFVIAITVGTMNEATIEADRLDHEDELFNSI